MDAIGIGAIFMIAVAVVFWLCALLMVYIYVGYPIAARVLGNIMNRQVGKQPISPTVCIVVAAYNEQESIRAKLNNLLELEYPTDLLEVVVVSDASSDATDDVVRAYPDPRVSLLRVEGRKGKTACQNIVAGIAKSDVLIFTDATTKLDRGCIAAMVANFADPEVGCVAGRLIYVDSQKSLTGAGGRTYWEYELGLRLAENKLGSLVGVSGCLYAVRRSAYRDIDPGIISDFAISLVMRNQGLRTVLEPAATCYEETLQRAPQEFGMRVRVALRSITALVREARFLNPIKYGLFSWQLLSHKALRYASPVIWAVLLICSAVLSAKWLYAAALCIQVLILVAGLVAWALHDLNRGLMVGPYYFVLTNAASLVAIVRFLRGDRVVIWRTVR